MSAPWRLTRDRLPDPWLLDTESLLSELGRARGLALMSYKVGDSKKRITDENTSRTDFIARPQKRDIRASRESDRFRACQGEKLLESEDLKRKLREDPAKSLPSKLPMSYEISRVNLS